jgi:inner membrane protein
MDPVTHALAGGLLAKSGLAHRLLPPELENRGVALTAVAALAPDIDAIVELGPDPLAFLRYHRGLTHSLLGGIGLAAVLALLVAPFFPGVPRRRLVALTTAGVYVHILLDLLTSYGTVLLYPFRSERFTFDWMWTFDPTFFGILLCCLLGVYLLRRAPRRAAQVGLGVAAGYVLIAGALQWVAIRAVAAEAIALDVGEIRNVAVVPAPFVPLNWTGIVETDDHYYRAHLQLSRGLNAEIRFVEVPKIPPEADPGTLRAVGQDPLREQVELYEWFARFPVVSVEHEHEGEGQTIRYYDLRFDLPGLALNQRPYVFTIRLSRDGEVLSTNLR